MTMTESELEKATWECDQERRDIVASLRCLHEQSKRAELYVATNDSEFTSYKLNPNYAGSLVFKNYGPQKDRTVDFIIPTAAYKLAGIGSGSVYNNRTALLLMFFEEISQLFYDAPLHFERAIAELRDLLKKDCSASSHKNCLHEKPVCFYLSHDDRSFARFFPLDRAPDRHWRQLSICVHRHGVHMRTAQFGNNNKRNDGWVIFGCTEDASLGELHRAYDNFCDSQYEFVLIESKNYGIRTAWHFDDVQPLKVLPRWRMSFTDTIGDVTFNDDGKVYSIKVFRGPLATFSKAALDKYLKDGWEGPCSIEALIMPAKPMLEFRSVDALEPKFRDLFSEIFDEAVVQKNLTALSTPMHWNNVHPILLDYAIALSALELPTYIILWILDFLPVFLHCRHIRKLRLIEGVQKSRQKILASREAH